MSRIRNEKKGTKMLRYGFARFGLFCFALYLKLKIWKSRKTFFYFRFLIKNVINDFMNFIDFGKAKHKM